MGEPEVTADKRRVVAGILAPHLEEAKARCADIPDPAKAGNPELHTTRS